MKYKLQYCKSCENVWKMKFQIIPKVTNTMLFEICWNVNMEKSFNSTFHFANCSWNNKWNGAFYNVNVSWYLVAHKHESLSDAAQPLKTLKQWLPKRLNKNPKNVYFYNLILYVKFLRTSVCGITAKGILRNIARVSPGTCSWITRIFHNLSVRLSSTVWNLREKKLFTIFKRVFLSNTTPKYGLNDPLHLASWLSDSFLDSLQDFLTPGS